MEERSYCEIVRYDLVYKVNTNLEIARVEHLNNIKNCVSFMFSRI